ncbi:class C sortase [Enterococcus florum]|uniref:Class C sortase n=1 Tax=Enterococcus florum TaxID=2480627 RepID=A0A4P5PDU3_9ENTE|nr:class C sortase [Enterococcus florum]GCF94744.1 class C sortase [Enterococcus florum]
MKREGKKRLVLDGVMMLVLILGTFAMLYPFVGDALNHYLDQQIISHYQKKSNAKNQKSMAQEQARRKAENQRIAAENNPGTDPFSEEKQPPKQPEKDYYETHTIGILKIPAIHVSLPIFDQTNELFLSCGASLLEGTSYPVGGKDTHAVISAHRGLMEAKLFTDLPKMQKKDHFYIEVNEQTLAYEVDDIQVIEPTELEKLEIVSGQEYVTLMTCTPYGVNSHRLLVRGERTSFEEKMQTEISKDIRYQNRKQSGVIAGSLLLVLLIGIIITKRVNALRKKG